VLFETNQLKIEKHSWKEIRVQRKTPSIAYIAVGLFAAIRSRVKPKLVIAHTGYAPIVIGFILSKILGVPFVPVMHGSDIRTVGRTSWLKYIQKMILEKASRILCVSEDIRRILVEEYMIDIGKTQIISNGYDDVLLSYPVKKIDSKNPKLVFVGYLRWEKDPLLALKVVNRIREKYNNVHLTIFGDGDMRERIELSIDELDIRSHVHLMGSKPHNEVIEMVSKSDIFILTSRHEGKPLALIEAMALAKPIVATNIDGVRELIVHEQNGMLVPVQDPEAMAMKIENLLRDQEMAEALGKQARQRVTNMSWKHIARMYNDLINKVTSG
jgi:glycosyltransferase involved in cell wall biosynthesis